MNARQKLGKKGERAAAGFLSGLGYKIIKLNYRCRFGEIDLIAVKDDILVFCEVKTRTGDDFGSPATAVDRRKILHITRSAEYFMASGTWERYQPRIDVVEVFPGEEPAINHIISIT